MRTPHIHLTRREAQAVVALRLDEITPLQPPVRLTGVRPLAVLIGGPPGAGKSTIQRLLQQSLGASSVAVSDLDDDLPAHPRYDAIMKAHGLQAPKLIRQGLPSDLGRRCLDHLRSLRCDVITSAPFDAEGSTKDCAHGFGQVDYRTVLVYVMTHEANSALGRADRYQRACDDVGYGRWSDSDRCLRCYVLIPDTAGAIEVASAVDDLYVVDRNGYVLYENHRGGDGLMLPPFRAKEEILAELNRPPTPEEHELFVATAQPLLNRDDLTKPVADLVQWAWDEHARRPAPQPLSRGIRLDQRLIDLRHITGSGLAPPRPIVLPSKASDSTRGPGPAGRTDGSRER